MIFDKRQCILGEGPLWHPARQDLFWFDILGRRLHSKAQSWAFDSYVSAAGWVDRDTLLVASDAALSRFDLTTGRAEVVVPLEADNPITRSNDGRADPFGGFWIGTMGVQLEDHAGAIYRYYKGELRQLYDRITVSNAICFSPDAGHAYFTDTPTQKIMQVALDGDGWPKGDPEVFLDFTGTETRPDGAVVDQAGNLWSAQWGAGQVEVFSPSGAPLEVFSFPAPQTTCPALGGPAFSTLYCTSAAEGLNGSEDGKTFVAETNHRGQAEHQVLL